MGVISSNAVSGQLRKSMGGCEINLNFVQFADNPPAGPGKHYGVTPEQ